MKPAKGTNREIMILLFFLATVIYILNRSTTNVTALLPYYVFLYISIYIPCTNLPLFLPCVYLVYARVKNKSAFTVRMSLMQEKFPLELLEKYVTRSRMSPKSLSYVYIRLKVLT